MTGFFIKKAFFDGWDHLWGLVALNLGALALLAGFVLAPLALELPGGAVWPGLGFLVLSAYSLVCAEVLKDAAEYRNLSLPAFREALKRRGVLGLAFGAALSAALVLFWISVPFYLSRGSFLGWFAAGTLFWCFLIALLALQWFPAVRALLPGTVKASVRKCFLLLADNLGFSILLALYSAAGLVVSVFSAFLVPGLSGTVLGSVVALRLVLKKYDWLEAHPGADRRKVPWEELLEEERELLGKRTLKGMIFPWKE
ncbi:MAG TPA: hypothetical protein P5117_09175 [Spirochaetia bacterium]|nr:hypothetical protein [Spirochaetales bacterium]HRZ89639.1 hypothetical protein [Spirochaetia bacterium]